MIDAVGGDEAARDVGQGALRCAHVSAHVDQGGGTAIVSTPRAHKPKQRAASAPTTRRRQAENRTLTLLEDHDRLDSMQAAALETAQDYSIERAALSEYLMFRRAVAERR